MTQPEQNASQPNRIKRVSSFIVNKVMAAANSEFVGAMADETARLITEGRIDPLTGGIVPTASPNSVADAHAVGQMAKAMGQVSTVADMWHQDGTPRR